MPGSTTNPLGVARTAARGPVATPWLLGTPPLHAVTDATNVSTPRAKATRTAQSIIALHDPYRDASKPKCPELSQCFEWPPEHRPVAAALRHRIGRGTLSVSQGCRALGVARVAALRGVAPR